MVDFPPLYYMMMENARSKAMRGHSPSRQTKEDSIAIFQGRLKPSIRPIYERDSGAASPGAVVWTTAVDPVLFSPELVAGLKKHGVTGVSFYPVVLEIPSGKVDGYCGLAVTGRSGPIVDALSELVPVKYPGGYFYNRKGLYFDQATWDGSDVFLAKDYFAILMTQRAVDVFKTFKVPNVTFTPIEDVLRPAMDVASGNA